VPFLLGPKVDSCEHMFDSPREQLLYIHHHALGSHTYTSDRSFVLHALLNFAVFLSKLELEKFVSSLLSKLPYG
jgi:hypothetical protein